jgi:hypothetical protein
MAECEYCFTDRDDADEPCPTCDAARKADEAYYRARYHPNLRPLEPGEHTPGIRRLQDCD